MSLLLDALRKAEKVKEARVSGEPVEAADIPLLMDKAQTAEAGGHGLVLVDMDKTPRRAREGIIEAPEYRPADEDSGYVASDPRYDRNDDTADSRAGVPPTFTVGAGEARSLFDLNAESTYRRRLRRAFIGTGITLIAVLSAYYGWLLYVAVKPSAGLVPRLPPANAPSSVAAVAPASAAFVEAGTAESVEDSVAAAAREEVSSTSQSGEPARGMQAPTTDGTDAASGEPATGMAAKAPRLSVLSTTEDQPSAMGDDGGQAVVAHAVASESAPARPVLTISRSRRPDPVFPRLAKAYAAYRAGDHAQAEADYRFVLNQEPENRDALLGLAALAVSRGWVEEAFEFYRRVLAANPGDQAALAALTSLQSNRDPLQSEHQLKRLLAKDPDAPYLHFALGNLYAAQGRWAQAQQAYFDAYRRDRENGDYAYNLAVGLDHLGEKQVALRYYRQALEIAGRQEVAFEPESVRRRVQMLSERPVVSGP